MLFEIKETGKVFEISMKTWSYNQWTPDFFQDMETSVPSMFTRSDETDGYLVSQAEFDEIVSFWKAECKAMRDGEQGSVADYTDFPTDTALFIDEKTPW